MIFRKILGSLWELLEAAILAAAVAFIVQWLVVQPNQIRGHSMDPTFADRELIFTEKISYYQREPERGEIIVFKSPRFLYQDYIKRVIGLPGEKIRLYQGKIYINGQKLDENAYLSDAVFTGPQSYLKEGRELTVGPDNYFVMGDNRPFSSDSREFGPINRQEIIGRVFFRYFPLDKISLIQNSNASKELDKGAFEGVVELADFGGGDFQVPGKSDGDFSRSL